MLGRLTAFIYGVICYLAFFAAFLYAIGFVGNLLVPKSIDTGPRGPLARSLVIDIGLLGLFAVQHSVMARPWFKRAWTRIVPEPAERSTYVLFSSLALAVLFWQWRPAGGVSWEVENPAGRWAIHGVYASGWLLLLASTCLIDHFDPFSPSEDLVTIRPSRDDTALRSLVESNFAGREWVIRADGSHAKGKTVARGPAAAAFDRQG